MKKPIILTAIFLLFYHFASGQYTVAGVKGKYYFDINPDTTLGPRKNESHDYYIDLNNDNINDIKIVAHYEYFLHYISVASLNSNTKLIGTTDSVWVIDSVHYSPKKQFWNKTKILKMYGINDTISYDSTFEKGFLGILDVPFGVSYASFRDWENKGDKYFGVKYNLYGNWWYGWVKIYVKGSAAITIKEYSLGIPESEKPKPQLCNNNQIAVYPNPTTSIVNFVRCYEYEGNFSRIVLYNSLGQQVNEKLLTEEDEFSIDLSDFGSGCYFYNLFNVGNNILQRGKIIKVK